MDEKEKKELVEKILSVDNDPKGSRVAVTVFTNKASKEDAKIFLDYLDHHSPAVKKTARHIVGQLGLVEAIDKLVAEFMGVVDSLNFMPDEEYKESHYYPNIIEILETVFTIIKSENLKNDQLFTRIDQIFKRTKNEDLRFTLIKLLGVLGDRLDYFMQIFDDLTEKERRALYYVYTFVQHPKRIDVYKRGLRDEPNFEYVISNLLNFEEGKQALSQELMGMGNYEKQTVLKKLQQGKYPEFNEVLIKLLNDKNKFLVELAIDNLKRTIGTGESLQPFIDMIESGYSPEGVSGALEIIAFFVKKNPEDIYLQGLEKQPAHKNKVIILEFLVEKLKKDIKPTEELTDKILPKLLSHFDNYVKEKEDLFFSIFRILQSLVYSNSGKVKAVKKKILGFTKEFDNRLSNTFRNNWKEFVVKLNHMIARFEESEAKIKNIVILFDIDATKIEHNRMLKLKEQVAELDYFDDETKARFVTFLSGLVSEPRIDWKVKTVALDLLGDYGGATEIAVLSTAIDNETSLAVKTNAQKALKKIEERHAAEIESVLVMEPLFYLQKILNEFFKAQGYKVFNLAEVSKFEQVTEKFFKYIAVSENFLTPEFTQQLFDYVDEFDESNLVIVTASPDKWQQYKDIPNIRLLKKPFNNDVLKEVIVG